jgi:hypothetical protein
LSSAVRTFGALLAHDGVSLVEYREEVAGIRVVDHWDNTERSTSIDEALSRLLSLVSALGVHRAKMSVAIEQFGVVHHVMTLPAAGDDVVRPVIQREVNRVFGLADPVVAFTSGSAHERRGPRRADARTAPRQLFIGAAPRETINTLVERFAAAGIDVEIATVVPKAIHSLYQATGASLEPTAVLVCLEGGPHLAFFLDGRLELAIDPPIALEGERAPVSVILDQVERGAVYFRQQFRGATATRMLLSARNDEYDALAAALEQRLGVHVKPLFAGANTPEAVVAMGAVLEGRNEAPLDLYPHPPTFAERAGAYLRGPNGVVVAAATAAVIAGVWFATQVMSLSSTQKENERLRAQIRTGVATIEPMRQIAERRADYARQVAFVTNSSAERVALTNTLRTIADFAPTGVRFDSLRVSRTADNWIVGLSGAAIGLTGAQAVRSLDAFYQSVRGRPGISSATLDEFSYPTPAPSADSARASSAPVLVQFHMSFTLNRPASGAK